MSFGQFAEKLSTTDYTVYKGNLKKYEVGSVVPSTEFYIRLAEVFGINLNWLIIGEGPTYRRQEATKKMTVRKRHSISA